MKLPIRFLLVNLTCLTVIFLVGCTGPIVKQAAFRRDPRGVRRGHMLGPFSGRVVDADSDKPLDDALVWCSWTFMRGIGSPAPFGTRVIRTRTGPDGNYRVPTPKALPSSASAQLASLSLVVYRRGYVAYRHDWRFGQQRRPRRDFAQLYNVVRLSRWSSELSHAQHLLFMGGSGKLREDASQELAMAAQELDNYDPSTASQPEAPPAKAEHQSLRRTIAQRLLDGDDVRAVTGFVGVLDGSPLKSAGDASSSWHLRAVDRPERYDLALRFWRLRGDALTAKLEELKKALPGHEPRPAFGDGAFMIKQGEILGLAFGDPSRDALVLLTCGSGQCSDETKLSSLVARITKRLGQLVPAKAKKKGKTP
ncbi:MAG: hypothetical protein JRH20_07810 [Deltaproteobacteria bacterium]|nr:hypothetical protein [Deltaproteobacteria bacterium]